MPEATEKITINLGVVDLGKIDLLVEQGYYANRTDFVKDAIRRSLDSHDGTLHRLIARFEAEAESPADARVGKGLRSELVIVAGIMSFNRRELEVYRAKGQRLRLVCVGMVMFADDVTPELANEMIESIRVYGSLRAPQAVRDALRSKMRS